MPSRHEWIDRKRWQILHAMADDWESPEQISKHLRNYAHLDITPAELADLIEELFTRHYIFLTLNTLFKKQGILAELEGWTDDRHFWFGQTVLGYEAWNQLQDRYFVEPE